VNQISTPAPFSAKAATAACCFAVTDGGYAAAVAISGASGCQLLRSADSAIGCALQLAATAIIVCGGLSRPRDDCFYGLPRPHDGGISLRGQRKFRKERPPVRAALSGSVACSGASGRPLDSASLH